MDLSETLKQNLAKLTPAHTIISWRTKKVAGGFEWIIWAMGYQTGTLTLVSGACSTRAKAAKRGKDWAKYAKGLRAAVARPVHGDIVPDPDYPGESLVVIELPTRGKSDITASGPAEIIPFPPK